MAKDISRNPFVNQVVPFLGGSMSANVKEKRVSRNPFVNQVVPFDSIPTCKNYLANYVAIPS